MDLQEIVHSVLRIRKPVGQFIDNSNVMIENTDPNNLTADEAFQFQMVYRVNNYLTSAIKLVEQMDKEVIAQGYLYKNKNDRYEVQGCELTSGEPIEIWNEKPDYKENGYYVFTRIEHNGKDYYAVDLGENHSLEGKKVRIRR